MRHHEAKALIAEVLAPKSKKLEDRIAEQREMVAEMRAALGLRNDATLRAIADAVAEEASCTRQIATLFDLSAETRPSALCELVKKRLDTDWVRRPLHAEIAEDL